MAYKPNPLAAFDLDYFAVLEDELFDSEDALTMRNSSVSFSDSVLIQEVTCISDMEISEIDDTWYTQQDFNAMKTECRQLAKTIKSDRIEESADICVRGLEEKLHRSHKKMNRSGAIIAVLDEQEAQWDDGKKNVEELAQVYHEFASHCLDGAVELARQDQEAAFAIHGVTSSSADSVSTQVERCTPAGVPGIGSLESRTMLVA